jgi:hypothetical protein
MNPHYAYTTVLNSQGWELIVEFLENDKQTNKPDDFITEQELLPYHHMVRYLTESFGLPQKGDVISPNTESGAVWVIERWFDFEKKQVTLRVL